MGIRDFVDNINKLSPEDQVEFDRMNTEYNSRVTLFLSGITALMLSAAMAVGYVSYTSGAKGVDEFWLVLPYHIACIALSVVACFTIAFIRRKQLQRNLISDVVSVVQICMLMLIFQISSHVEIRIIGIKNINAMIIVMFALGFFLRYRIGLTLILEAAFTSATIAFLFIEKNDISNFYPSVINIICSFVVASFAAVLYWDSRKSHFLSTKRLELLATSDALTRLHNRRSFDVYIERAWRRAGSANHYIMLFFIDVDHFKRYNDIYGHIEGDKCLCAIADTISASVRKNDFVARYGGEEFVVTLTGENTEIAERVAEEMLNALREQNIPHGDSVAPYITISIGCMICKPDQHGTAGMDELIKKADAALYMAKDQGRNRLVMHPDAVMHLDAVMHPDAAAL